jgi:hypothetical protein
MSDAPFILARATESDIDEIAELEYDCFPEFVRRLFMGCHSRADLKKCKDRHLKHMQNDPNDAWIKVTDKKTGRIVAASNWKLYVNGQSHGGAKEEPPEDLEGEDLKKSREIFEKMNATKADKMPGPFIRSLFADLFKLREVVDAMFRSAHLLHRRELPSSRRWRDDVEMGL